MKILKYLTLSALAAAFTLTGTFADDDKGKKPEKEKKKAPTEEQRGKRFDKMDADSNGKLAAFGARR